MHKIVDESTVKEVSEKKLAELKENANAILFEIRRQLMQKQPFIDRKSKVAKSKKRSLSERAQ